MQTLCVLRVVLPRKKIITRLDRSRAEPSGKTTEEYNPTVDFGGTGDHYLHPPPETIVCLANLVQVIIMEGGQNVRTSPTGWGKLMQAVLNDAINM